MAVAVSPGLPQTATWADRAAVIHYRAADTAPDTSMARASPAQAAQQPSAVADTPQLHRCRPGGSPPGPRAPHPTRAARELRRCCPTILTSPGPGLAERPDQDRCRHDRCQPAIHALGGYRSTGTPFESVLPVPDGQDRTLRSGVAAAADPGCLFALPPCDQGSQPRCTAGPGPVISGRGGQPGWLRWCQRPGVVVRSVRCSAADLVDDPDVRFPVLAGVVVTVDMNGGQPGREDVVAGLGEGHAGP